MYVTSCRDVQRRVTSAGFMIFLRLDKLKKVIDISKYSSLRFPADQNIVLDVARAIELIRYFVSEYTYKDII